MQDLPDRRRTRQGRILVTAFFVVLVALSLGFTLGIAPMLQGVQQDVQSKIPHWTCEEILTGDRLRVASLNTTQVVHVRGIACPPMEEGEALTAMSEVLDFPEPALMHQGRMARNTLSAWIYKRRLEIEFVPPPDGIAEGAPAEAYIDVFGVDIGRKMLQGGQAMAVREAHPRREAYQRYEAEARAGHRGIWRTL